jgi:hypothetical protein
MTRRFGRQGLLLRFLRHVSTVLQGVKKKNRAEARKGYGETLKQHGTPSTSWVLVHTTERVCNIHYNIEHQFVDKAVLKLWSGNAGEICQLPSCDVSLDNP